MGFTHTNKDNDDPSNPIHLSLIDILMHNFQQVSRDSQPIVKYLYSRPDLQIISDGFIQR